MNIDDMTIGAARKLSNMFNTNQTNKASIYTRYIGEYVICRTRNEGVNAGKVVNLDDTGVVLEDARRLYYHRPIKENVSWYEGVAKYGVSDDSKLGVEAEKLIVEDYSLTLCTKEAEESIRGAKNHEQS